MKPATVAALVTILLAVSVSTGAASGSDGLSLRGYGTATIDPAGNQSATKAARLVVR